MKCEFCAGNLNINDERCPHCDAVNPFYTAHREDMNRIKNSVAKTEDEVIRTTKRFTSSSLYIAVISLLILLVVICTLVLANIRSINHEIFRSQNAKKAAEYLPIVEEMAQNGDYLDLHGFMYNRFEYSKDNPLKPYMAVESVAGSYKSVVGHIGALVNNNDLRKDPDEIAKDIDRCLGDIYKERYERSVSSSGNPSYDPDKLEIMDDIIEQLNALMVTYLGASEEKLGEFPEMTSLNRTVYLSELIRENYFNEEEE